MHQISLFQTTETRSGRTEAAGILSLLKKISPLNNALLCWFVGFVPI
jgi:hypothetical protein